MANREVTSGSGYAPNKPLEIGVWEPNPSGSGSNSSTVNQIPVMAGAGYQHSNPNLRLDAQRGINSDFATAPSFDNSVMPQQSQYYTPVPDSCSPQQGYTGQMLAPASNTYPQYQNSGYNTSLPTLPTYTAPPQNYVQTIGDPTFPAHVQSYQNFNTEPPAGLVPMQPPPNSNEQIGVYRSPRVQYDRKTPDHVDFNSNPRSAPASAFKNPLMNEASGADEDLNLLKNMHISNAHHQNSNVKYPVVLSKASLAQLKHDLEKAAAPFESPEALKLAREKELGLHSADDIGVNVILSKLSVEATAFVPRSRSPAPAPAVASKEQEQAIIYSLNALIDNVLTQPGSFDELSSFFIKQAQQCLYSAETVKEIARIIFTKAIDEDNFKYLGARLCDKLTMPKVLTSFRTIFLNHFQGEFKKIRSIVDARKDEDRPKIHGFFMFMAEVFIHIKVDGKPLISFGKSLNKALGKLLENSNSSDVTFVCKILKLAGAKLLDAFEGNDIALENYQKIFTILKEYFEKHKDKRDAESKRISLLISSVSRLKDSNWGRTKSNTRPKSDIDDPEQYGDELSEVDQNYYMNEPVFFTPDGVQYTAAEAQIPEFYEQYLAKYNLRPDVPFDDSSSYTWSKSDGFGDYVPSDDEEEFYKQENVEGEYESEFEKFLAESGQLP